MSILTSKKQQTVRNVDLFKEELTTVSDAAIGVILIRTKEFFRCLDVLQLWSIEQAMQFKVWTILTGWQGYRGVDELSRNATHDPAMRLATNGVDTPISKDSLIDINRALTALAESNDFASAGCFVMVCPQFGFSMPSVQQRIKNHVKIGAENRQRLILMVPPSCDIPQDIEDDLHILDFNQPSHNELRQVWEDVLDNLIASQYRPNFSAEDVDIIIQNSIGMTHNEFETSLAMAFVKNMDKLEADVSSVKPQDFIDTLMETKVSVIKKTDILELMPRANMGDVGGLDILKDWVIKRKLAFSDEARAFGVDPPKGILITGVPGCLTGDTIINVSRKGETGGTRPIRLDTLFLRFNGKHNTALRKGLISNYAREWDLSYSTKTHSFKGKDEYIGVNVIEGVIYSGTKTVFKLKTDYGQEIAATGNHKFLTPNGYVSLKDLSVGDTVCTHIYGVLPNDNSTGRNNKLSNLEVLTKQEHARLHMQEGPQLNKYKHALRHQTITSIEPAGIQHTYDIQMRAPYNNFVANGFIVHNSGKSLLGKAIADTLNIPCVKFDIGKVFGKYVGDSEARMRKALSLIDAMAPVVLLVDEVDKAFGGIGGGGDSGTSSRVLGTFLTWMQERKSDSSPVFLVMTANNVNGLPPELLRKGRLDEIFAATMPSAKDRAAILKIHIEKRGHKLSDAELQILAAKTDTFVGAELEAVVKNAIIEVFSSPKRVLTLESLLTQTAAIIPMSRAFKDKIELMNEWAKNNAKPASSDAGLEGDTDGATSSRQLRRSTRLKPTKLLN